jgi:hypothetical protein
VEHPPSLVALFVAPLNRSGIEYMVTGGWIERLGLREACGAAQRFEEPD